MSHEATDSLLLGTKTMSLAAQPLHVNLQPLVIIFHYIKTLFEYVSQRLSPEPGHASTLWANREIVTKRLVDGRSQSHVQCTVGNGSMKQREELSDINVAGKTSPQNLCVCANVVMNRVTYAVL